MLVFGYDSALGLACSNGSLELNPFMPLIAACLLESLDLLARACDILSRHAVDGIEANEAKCREQVENSTALVTALIPEIGYDAASKVATQAAKPAGAFVKSC